MFQEASFTLILSTLTSVAKNAFLVKHPEFSNVPGKDQNPLKLAQAVYEFSKPFASIPIPLRLDAALAQTEKLKEIISQPSACKEQMVDMEEAVGNLKEVLDGLGSVTSDEFKMGCAFLWFEGLTDEYSRAKKIKSNLISSKAFHHLRLLTN